MADVIRERLKKEANVPPGDLVQYAAALGAAILAHQRLEKLGGRESKSRRTACGLVFDFLAGRAARLAGGSAMKLFALVYGVGTVVTVFMSNDATAVVLTPAVFAATKAAKVKDPLPYLLICAFIANAASFVLPISNPANLIIFRDHMPPLLQWLGRFALPSILSIAVTYAVLRFTLRDSLKQEVMAAEVDVPALSSGGRLTAWASTDDSLGTREGHRLASRQRESGINQLLTAESKLLRSPQPEENARTCDLFSDFLQRARKSRTVWRRGADSNPRDPLAFDGRNVARGWPTIRPE